MLVVHLKLTIQNFISRLFIPPWRKRIVWLAGLGIIGTIIFFTIPVSRPDDGGKDFDMQVVLGGNTRERSGISRVLWSRHPTPVLVTGDDGLIVSELIRLGVGEGEIIHESRAHSTWENASLSVPILQSHGVRSAVIVTSGYHSARARSCFEKLAPGIRFFTCTTPREDRSAWVRFRLGMRERCARIGYGLGHGINPWSTGR